MGCGEIQLENIYLELAGKKVLNNVSLHMDQGKIQVIFGKSGSGKTSLLNVMNGLYIPTKGDYYFEDKKVDYQNELMMEQLRKKIGYFHQELALMEHMTLEDNLKIFSMIQEKELNEQDIKKQLERMEISHLYKKNVSLFSGGERQRAAFLKLLVIDYPTILIDEPTNNLDDENAAYIIRCIRQLGDTGKNVVVVSHSNKLLEIADVIYRMEEINEAF